MRLEPRTLTSLTGLIFAIAGAIGFVISLGYGLLEGWDQALGPPWTLTIAFAGAVWLARRSDRLGLVGTIIALLIATSYLSFGQLSDPITGWAYGHHFGFAVYITAALLASAVAVIATLLELSVRVRHGGRL